jgi:hypothetical protein
MRPLRKPAGKAPEGVQACRACSSIDVTIELQINRRLVLLGGLA